jgi:hypothetical protein
VAPISDWPDSDWYLPCEAESADFNNDLILALARSYNTLLCSLIRNSMTVWAPTKRRVRGHLDLILTNFTPSKLSELVEQQVRSFTLKWIGEHDCCLDKPPEKSVHQDPLTVCKLRKGLVMEFSSDGDMAFWRDRSSDRELLAIIVVNASLDTATALEEYSSAAERFRDALNNNVGCENILLSVDDSAALAARVRDDGLVTQHWNLMPLLARPAALEDFYTRFFRSTLALI